MKALLLSLLVLSTAAVTRAEEAKPAAETPAPTPAAPAADTAKPAAEAPAPAPAAPAPADAPKPTAEAPAPTPAAPAPAAPAAGEVAKLKLGVLPAVMKFDVNKLSVKPGQKVMLLFRNEKCPLQHNFLLVKAGKLAEVGALADKMLTDPEAIKKHYTPESPEVLAHSNKLIGIGQSDLIEFTAPTEPGDYPYLCTFPGHWRLMNGVLKVAP